MFTVVWSWLVKSLMFFYIRKPRFIAWVNSLSLPVTVIHSEFLQFRQDILYKLRFTGQIIYLEHILNDMFDPVNRAIYIDNVADTATTIIYYKSELKPKTFLYYKYNPVANYQADDFVVEGDKVYKCIAASTGLLPSANPAQWQLYKVRPSIKYKSEQLAYDFIVMVPSGLIFNIDQMKALVDYYKLLGKAYQIITY